MANNIILFPLTEARLPTINCGVLVDMRKAFKPFTGYYAGEIYDTMQRQYNQELKAKLISEYGVEGIEVE